MISECTATAERSSARSFNDTTIHKPSATKCLSLRTASLIILRPRERWGELANFLETAAPNRVGSPGRLKKTIRTRSPLHRRPVRNTSSNSQRLLSLAAGGYVHLIADSPMRKWQATGQTARRFLPLRLRLSSILRPLGEADRTKNPILRFLRVL